MTHSPRRPAVATHPEFLIHASATRPGDDPIFALNGEATRRAREGEDVLNATLGALLEDDGQLAVLPTVMATLRATADAKVASYAPILGDREFLDAVRRDLFADGPAFAHSVACATPGGSGALHTAIVHFLEPGQALLTPHLYWGPYETFAHHTGRRVQTFPMFAADGRFALEALEHSLAELSRKQDRVLVILNSPCNNPTGYSFDASEWQAAVEILRSAAQRTRVTLVVDLAYSQFAAELNEDWLRAVEPALGELLVLVAWSASKSHALYGARVGALVAVHPDVEQRRRIENALAYSCRGTWSNCNHAGLLAVARLLSDPVLKSKVDEERERLRKLLWERVTVFNTQARAAGLSYPRYEGGFFVTVFAERPAEAARIMRDEAIFVVPVQGALRVALCSTPRAKVDRLVQALSRGIAARP